MEKELKQIEEKIDRLYGMYQSHMVLFENQTLTDLGKQSQERKHEVESLMGDIKKLLAAAENKTEPHVESMILVLKDRLTTLFELNKALRTKVSCAMDGLKKGMQQMSKGKTVIRSYRSVTTVSNRPRVISMTIY